MRRLTVALLLLMGTSCIVKRAPEPAWSHSDTVAVIDNAFGALRDALNRI